MGAHLIVGGVFFIVSLFLLLAGYQIAVKKQLWLIAGYEPDRVRDKDGLATFVGMALQVMGAFELLISILVFLLPDAINILGTAFAGVVFGIVVILFLNVRRFL